MPTSLCTSLWLCLRTLAVLKKKKNRKAARVSLKNIIHSFLARFSIAPVLSIYTSSGADFIKAPHWIMNVPVQAQVYKKVLTHQDVPKMINVVKSFSFLPNGALTQTLAHRKNWVESLWLWLKGKCSCLWGAFCLIDELDLFRTDWEQMACLVVKGLYSVCWEIFLFLTIL